MERRAVQVPVRLAGLVGSIDKRGDDVRGVAIRGEWRARCSAWWSGGRRTSTGGNRRRGVTGEIAGAAETPGNGEQDRFVERVAGDDESGRRSRHGGTSSASRPASR